MAIKESLFEITENVSELNFILGRIEVLSDDVVEQVCGRINLKTERGLTCARHELEVAKIKADMLQSCVCEAVSEIKKLAELSENTYEIVRSDTQRETVENDM